MPIPEVVVVMEGIVVVVLIVVDEGMVVVEGIVLVEDIVVDEGMEVVEVILLPEFIVVVEVILVPEVLVAACAAAASERMRSAVSAIFLFICFAPCDVFSQSYSMKRATFIFTIPEAGVAVNHIHPATKVLSLNWCRFLQRRCRELHKIRYSPDSLLSKNKTDSGKSS